MSKKARNPSRAHEVARHHKLDARLAKLEQEVERSAARTRSFEAKLDTIIAHSDHNTMVAKHWGKVAPELGNLWMTAITAQANGDSVSFTAAAVRAFSIIGNVFSHSIGGVITTPTITQPEGTEQRVEGDDQVLPGTP